MRRHALTDEEWSRIEPLLPSERGRRARPAKLSNRTFMNALFYVAKTGVPWRDLPERFGPWKTIHAKFSRWNKLKVFDRILQCFAQDADREAAIVDSTYVKAHQHSAGGKGGPKFSVLDALAEVSLPKSMLSWTVLVTPSTSTSPPATSTTSPRPRASSRQRPPTSPTPSSSSKPPRTRAGTSSPTKPTTPISSSPPRRPKA